MQISKLLSTILTIAISGLVLLIATVYYAVKILPDTTHLTEVDYQVPLKIFSRDMKLIGLYGEKFRHPVNLSEIPPKLQLAYIAIEDQRFYNHPGVDPIGLARAAANFISTGRKSQGASTISMQVARNFFLTNEKTWMRKINEILLALKIEATLSKEKILELYLNKIYLGNRAYGVAAAGEVYYGKNLDELTTAQMAMLAGLPKAPSSANPIRNPEKAVARRNLVLRRMYEEGYINLFDYHQAINEPDEAKYHGIDLDADMPHVSQIVHQLMLKAFGQETHTRGFKVITTINSQLQEDAKAISKSHLDNYIKKRGLNQIINIKEQRFDDSSSWLKGSKSPLPRLTNVAVIMENDGQFTVIKNRQNDLLAIDALPDLIPGQLIQQKDGEWQPVFYNKPEIGAVVLSTQTGAILSLVGSLSENQYFNRATQAYRQVGSTFKPLLYATALSNGMNLASVVNDSPYVAYGGDTDLVWRPSNHDYSYSGPMRLRDAMVFSRNLVSIRLLDMIGIRNMIEMSTQFGLDSSTLPNDLSLALGSGTATPLMMASAYTTFSNQGLLSKPFIIERIYDQKNQEIPVVTDLNIDGVYFNQQTPEAVLKPEVAYLMFDLLKDVVKRGTARRARVLNRTDIAGKTGTTNDLRDAWFCGLNGQYSASVWVGFDDFSTLKAYSSQLALPIWTDIMAKWLKNKPSVTPEKPNNIVSLKIQPLHPEQKNQRKFELFDQSAPEFTQPEEQTATSSDNRSDIY